jgi:hypothetical protein
MGGTMGGGGAGGGGFGHLAAFNPGRTGGLGKTGGARGGSGGGGAGRGGRAAEAQTRRSDLDRHNEQTRGAQKGKRRQQEERLKKEGQHRQQLAASKKTLEVHRRVCAFIFGFYNRAHPANTLDTDHGRVAPDNAMVLAAHEGGKDVRGLRVRKVAGDARAVGAIRFLGKTSFAEVLLRLLDLLGLDYARPPPGVGVGVGVVALAGFGGCGSSPACWKIRALWEATHSRADFLVPRAPPPPLPPPPIPLHQLCDPAPLFPGGAIF